jgi:hypothetical protein
MGPSGGRARWSRIRPHGSDQASKAPDPIDLITPQARTSGAPATTPSASDGAVPRPRPRSERAPSWPWATARCCSRAVRVPTNLRSAGCRGDVEELLARADQRRRGRMLGSVLVQQLHILRGERHDLGPRLGVGSVRPSPPRLRRELHDPKIGIVERIARGEHREQPLEIIIVEASCEFLGSIQHPRVYEGVCGAREPS